MFFIRFPLDISCWIFFEKLRMENLTNHESFICGEIFLRFLESEKYPSRKVSENFIGKTRNCVGFVDIEGDSKAPSSNPNCYRTGSTFGEYQFWLFIFEYFSRIRDPLQEFEWIEKNPQRFCTRKFKSGNRYESNICLLCLCLLHTRRTSDPEKRFG